MFNPGTLARGIALATAFLCTSAAGAVDADRTIRIEALPAAHAVPLHCRIYFGCSPLAQTAPHPLGISQE